MRVIIKRTFSLISILSILSVFIIANSAYSDEGEAGISDKCLEEVNKTRPKIFKYDKGNKKYTRIQYLEDIYQSHPIACQMMERVPSETQGKNDHFCTEVDQVRIPRDHSKRGHCYKDPRKGNSGFSHLNSLDCKTKAMDLPATGAWPGIRADSAPFEGPLLSNYSPNCQGEIFNFIMEQEKKKANCSDLPDTGACQSLAALTANSDLMAEVIASNARSQPRSPCASNEPCADAKRDLAMLAFYSMGDVTGAQASQASDTEYERGQFIASLNQRCDAQGISNDDCEKMMGAIGACYEKANADDSHASCNTALGTIIGDNSEARKGLYEYCDKNQDCISAYLEFVARNPGEKDNYLTALRLGKKEGAENFVKLQKNDPKKAAKYLNLLEDPNGMYAQDFAKLALDPNLKNNEANEFFALVKDSKTKTYARGYSAMIYRDAKGPSRAKDYLHIIKNSNYNENSIEEAFQLFNNSDYTSTASTDKIVRERFTQGIISHKGDPELAIAYSKAYRKKGVYFDTSDIYQKNEDDPSKNRFSPADLEAIAKRLEGKGKIPLTVKVDSHANPAIFKVDGDSDSGYIITIGKDRWNNLPRDEDSGAVKSERLQRALSAALSQM
ncbi:MAG: hypothetical protein ABIA04_06670 [Pseudomonadota bacterium]